MAGPHCLSMIAASMTGVWAATETPPPITTRWVQPPDAPSPPFPQTLHYFLIVTKDAGGNLQAFVKNPETNAGVFAKNLKVSGNSDGTVLVTGLGDRSIAFHRASTDELRWYYPRETQTWTYHRPQPGSDGWRTGTLREAGLREAPLASLMQSIVSLHSPALHSPYIQSIAIARHRILALDEYFYGFTAASLHDVRSAGKSVTTLMVGRAIEDTRKFTPASPVLQLLPQYFPPRNPDARKDRITVEHLMTMSPGFACDDNNDDSPGNEDAMQSQTSQPDWYRYTIDLPMLYAPGTRSLYCTAGINLLGAVVSSVTGTPLTQYFYERFAKPMQFQNYAMWLTPTNVAYMGGGDYFRPRDFMKFGQLFLNHGLWNGTPVIDESWLRESAIARTAPEGEGDRYGYGWHLVTLSVNGTQYEVINAGGNGGQVMAVVPQLDMVVMITGGNYNQFAIWKNFLPDIVGAAIRAAAP